MLWVEWAGRISACQDQMPGELCESLAPKKGKKKSKWVPFGGPCQGMSLREHTMYNRVSTRSLLGDGKSERLSQSGDMKEAGRQTNRGIREDTRETTRREVVRASDLGGSGGLEDSGLVPG